MTDAASMGAAARSLPGQAQEAGAVGAAPAQGTVQGVGQSAGADARFAQSMDRAVDRAMDGARVQSAAPLATPQAVEAPNGAMKGVFDKLSSLDGQAKSLADEARAAQASGQEMTPGEMVQLSMRAHEFMFNAQLTSNMANRTSDGLQQLFKQQS